MNLGRPLRGRAADGGFIVVAVLWILAALAALVSIFALYVANTELAVAVGDDDVAAEALVKASLELTAYHLPAELRRDRPTRGDFSYRLGRANVHVDFRSESARIDLNMAPNELLAALFTVLGAKPADAAQYADRIDGWRTAPSNDAQDKETSLYRAAGLNYRPRGGPFASVEELALVVGLPPALVEAAKPYVTVYSGHAEVNAHDAAPVVVAALGRSSSQLGTGMGGDVFSGPQGASSQGPPRGTTIEGSKAMRVTVGIRFDNGRQFGSEAVILLDTADAPYHVLSWQDDIDARQRTVAAGPRGVVR